MSAVAGLASAVAVAGALLPGIFTNEEQVYFAKEAGQTPPPWVGLKISPAADGLRLQTVDAFGKPGAEDQIMTLAASGDGVTVTTGKCVRRYVATGESLKAESATGRCKGPATISTIAPAGVTLTMQDGTALELRRAREWRCWGAIPKAAKKADGSADWWGARDLPLFDQGGMALLSTDEAKPTGYILRMRNVVWPKGPNQPSIVLYVDRPEEPGKAISYGWADPDAKRVGINLRTMQASCSLVG